MDSSNLYQIPATKALFGAAFLEYFFYSIIYIIEGFKLEEFQGSVAINANKNKKPQTVGNQQQQQQNNSNTNQQENEENQNPVDLKEIAVGEEQEAQPNQEAQNVQPPTATVNQSMTDDEEDTSFEMPFLILIPKHYQKSTIWFMLVLALCLVRNPNNFTISMAYIQVLFRIVQIIGLVVHKRLIASIGYFLSSLCIILLFFAAMIRGMTEYISALN